MSTPTPIDPADIRPGDVVERREVCTIESVEADRCSLYDSRGFSWDVVGETGVTWHLVHRPDPDAEAVEVLAKAACTSLGHARGSITRLRDQGWDVVRRAES